MSVFLALSAFLLLVVIAVQDCLYPPLRQETVSDGLYGPYHWYLDAAYVVLATMLVLTFKGQGALSETLAAISAGSLMVTAVTNTFSGWVDKIKAGLHVKLHTWFSILMFLSMLGLEVFQNHGWLWWISGAGIVLPIVTYGICQIKKLGIAAGPAAEKVAVFFLCAWLVAWSVV